jgi:large subunit ribosomal protein L10
VYKFQKDNADRWSIVGGIFEGKFMDKASMTEIATIPGEHQLRGMFVNVINSPIQGFVIALNAIAEKKA